MFCLLTAGMNSWLCAPDTFYPLHDKRHPLGFFRQLQAITNYSFLREIFVRVFSYNYVMSKKCQKLVSEDELVVIYAFEHNTE